jgi:Mrp family chromosome partitioning ATPase
MGTEKALVTSELVAGRAAANLGLPVADLVTGVDVAVPVDTQILQITASSGEPADAQRRAQALAAAYVAYKSSSPFRTIPERARIAQPAALPSSPSSPNTPLTGAAGLVAGLVLGLLAALVRDRLDDRVRGAGELERRGLPVLAVVPPSHEPAPAPDVLVLRAPDSAAARAYGSLGEQVVAGTHASSVAVVVVTSARPEKGTSSVAANLAADLALNGRQVVIVDADVRASQDQPAAATDRPGLLDVLSHRVPLADALQPTRVPRLQLVALGNRTAGSPAQLVGARWTETSAKLASSFDLVVVAAAPVLASADGLRVAHPSAGVILVVHDRHSTRTDLDRAVVELTRVAAPVLGCVLIGHDRSWGPLRRPLRHLRRRKAQRRTDHASDYAQQLSADAGAGWPGVGLGPVLDVDPAATDPYRRPPGRDGEDPMGPANQPHENGHRPFEPQVQRRDADG